MSASSWLGSRTAAAPPRWRELEESARAVRRWKVLHAGSAPHDLQLLTEAQAKLGMRPSFALSLAVGSTSRPGLLGSWNEVKTWRTQLAASGAGAADVVHAHEFAAGMAALRAGYPLVYAFRAPLEDWREGGFQAGAWLRRSMRVAEQFLLTRAGAVVVHSHAMWNRAVGRGVATENLFLIPDPIGCGGEDADFDWLRRLVGERNSVILYAPGIVLDSTVSPEAKILLEAFAFVREELEGARLLLQTRSPGEIGNDGVTAIGAADAERALAAADVVISFADSEGPDAVALAAMSRGRPLLSADRAGMREVSADGRG
ncbi:MAG TPA: glycosyltransferase, partial [Rudaea sp.]|nr:glycosyltransferase [Rudaea sp.]